MSNPSRIPGQTKLLMPEDFPLVDYNAVYACLKLRSALYWTAFEHFQASWQAVSYRFLAVDECDLEFTASVGVAGPWSLSNPQQHYIQERSLFGFFVSGLAALESFAFAAYMVGAMKKGTDFPIATLKDLKHIEIKSTQQNYAKAFPQIRLTDELGKLLTDPKFKEWEDLRNVLAQRVVPVRRIRLTVDSRTQIARDITEFWKTDPSTELAIDGQTTTVRRAWLADILSTLIPALHEFIQTR
jgi:hypothetical protein